MNPRILTTVRIGGLVLSLQGWPSVPWGDASGVGDGLLAGAARVLPPTVLTVEAEDRDVETTLAITILDHVPDLRRAAGGVRRLLVRP